jgi:hypothetical protein
VVVINSPADTIFLNSSINVQSLQVVAGTVEMTVQSAELNATSVEISSASLLTNGSLAINTVAFNLSSGGRLWGRTLNVSTLGLHARDRTASAFRIRNLSFHVTNTSRRSGLTQFTSRKVDRWTPTGLDSLAATASAQAGQGTTAAQGVGTEAEVAQATPILRVATRTAL